MKLVKVSDEYVFITTDSETYLDKEAIFINEEAYKFVSNYLNMNNIKMYDGYWDDNMHDSLKNVIASMSKFDKRDVGNAISALLEY